MTDLITRATSLKPTIVTVPATATAPEQQVAAIPVSELGSAADLVTSCEQCKLDLTASQSNVSSLQKQVGNDATALKAMQAERDDYKTALKGGTFWSKVKHDSKVVLIGIGIGVVTGELAAHRGL